MKIYDSSTKKGFTLIELLVVISIISLLASVILAGMTTARAKARDAAVKRNVLEFSKLMALEYSDTSSYNALNGSWRGDGTASNNNRPCNHSGDANAYTGRYASNAIAICEGLRRIPRASAGNFLHTGTSLGNDNHFSIMAILSNNHYFCVGSSGRTYQGPATPSGTSTAWVGSGCYANP